MTIQTKITAPILVLAVVLGGVLAFQYVQITAEAQFLQQRPPVLRQQDDLVRQLVQLHEHQAQAVTAFHDAPTSVVSSNVRSLQREIETVQTQLNRLMAAPVERQLYADYADEAGFVRFSIDQLLLLGSKKQTTRLYEQWQRQNALLTSQLRQMQLYTGDALALLLNEMAATRSTLLDQLRFVGLGIGLILLLLGLYYRLVIAVPIRALVASTRSVIQSGGQAAVSTKGDDLHMLTQYVTHMASGYEGEPEKIMRLEGELASTKTALDFASRRLTGILEGTTDWIAAVDGDYRFIAFNRAYAREFKKLFGSSIAVSMSLLEDALRTAPEQERKRQKELWGKALNGEQCTETIDYGEDPTLRRSYDFSYSPIRDEHSKVIGASLIVRDVTERRAAEAALKQAKDQIELEVAQTRTFQFAVESSTDAVQILLPNGSLAYANAAWQKLTGHVVSESVGKNMSLFKTDGTQAALLTSMKKAMDADEAFHSDELIGVRKDGTEYCAELTLYPLKKGKTAELTVGVLHDVTSRKRTERAQSEFVSLASHQLRTPLTAIRLVLGALQRSEIDLKVAEGKETIDRSMEYVVHMAETIHTMLNISRLEAGKLTVQLADVALADLIQEVVADYQMESQRRRQTVEIHCSATLRVQTDRPLLKEVVANLVSNAIKYTPDSGTVTLKVEKQGASLAIIIADSGYGIPVAEQAKIFTKFFRADNVTKRETAGTGLGLYMVRELVRLLGGTITFTSAENRGTLFTVLLPCT